MAKKSGYQEAPFPVDEKERLVSLYKLNILDTKPEERFDRITKLALFLFNVPISTVTLVDSKREWFKSCQGLSVREGRRAISFCGHALVDNEIFVVSDTKKDPRFAENPMVVGKPFIRFYAGISLKSADGKKVGVFCVKDYKPRKFSGQKINLLKVLGDWAELELNSHELSQAIKARREAEEKLFELNEVLRLLNKILRHDILNHLTVIKGNAKFLTEGKRRRESLDDVILAADKSVSLIKKMAELESAISSGFSFKKYNMRGVFNEVIKFFPTIEFNLKGNGFVLADEAINSVIENIINNAKIHGKTKKINVTIKKKNNFVEIKIADFGIGISPRLQKKIFIDRLKSGYTVHGLGLYIIRKTILRYKGKIELCGNKPKGAVFIISLPKA